MQCVVLSFAIPDSELTQDKNKIESGGNRREQNAASAGSRAPRPGAKYPKFLAAFIQDASLPPGTGPGALQDMDRAAMRSCGAAWGMVSCSPVRRDAFFFFVEAQKIASDIF